MAQSIARQETVREIAGTVDPVWSRVQQEAEAAMRAEPALASFLVSTIGNHESLETAVTSRVASRLAHPAVCFELLTQTFAEALDEDRSFSEAIRADILAIVDRDPATTRLIEPILYFKGFHAIQTHRLAHWLWNAGRRDFALYLQSRSSEVFQTDINPAARIGRGIFLDHATGLVVGRTAVIEDDVSILQGVTLGGTGKERGDRHPKIRRGVLLGAGAKVLGNIEVGQCSRVASGSVVLQSVPRNTTVAGVPARVVGTAGCAEPARSMDQILSDKEGLSGRRLPPGVPRGKRSAPPVTTRGQTLDKTELAKIERFLRKTFANQTIKVVPRPRKADSAEVMVGEEFIGVIFLDDEEGDRSYNFQMAILSEDIQE